MRPVTGRKALAASQAAAQALLKSAAMDGCFFDFGVHG
jgi:hypothetical protein